MLVFITKHVQCTHCGFISDHAFAGASEANAFAAASCACSQMHQEPCPLQGVFTSLYGGVGGGLGGLLGGYVYSTYGAAAVFQVGLIVISVGWILCTICQVIASCMCRARMPTADRHDSAA